MKVYDAWYDSLPVYRLKEKVAEFQLTLPKGTRPTRANLLDLLAEHTGQRCAAMEAQRKAVAALEAQLAREALDPL